jgi:hypothetical protein
VLPALIRSKNTNPKLMNFVMKYFCFLKKNSPESQRIRMIRESRFNFSSSYMSSSLYYCDCSVEGSENRMSEISAFFSVSPLWEIHNSQFLELVMSEQAESSKIFVYHCRAALEFCRLNPENSSNRCQMCIWQSKRNISKFLSQKVRNAWLEYPMINPELDQSFQLIKNHSDMLNFAYDCHPFGRSVISQLQTVERESSISESIITSRGNTILKNAVQVYEFFLSELQKHEVTKCLVFGGRYSAERALIFASEKLGIPYYTFETGSRNSRIWLSRKGETSFDSYISDVIDRRTKFASSLQVSEVMNTGQMFFDNWKSGKSENPQYLNPNLKNRLLNFEVADFSVKTEDNYGAKKKILVIFTSTNYEVMAFDDYQVLNEINVSQFEIIARISGDARILSEYAVVVRWHPNSATSGEYDANEISKCVENSRELTHITAESKIDSYDLLERADIVVTFGSTIGIEAAAQGKTSILLAKSSYSNLGSVYEPKSYEDFIDLVLGDPKPLSAHGALIWGWWRETFGREMRFISLERNRFFLNGKRVESPILTFRRKMQFYRHKIKFMLTS